MEQCPGVIPYATLVQESLPMEGKRPALLFPPPCSLLIKDDMREALPCNDGILYNIPKQNISKRFIEIAVIIA